MDCFTHQKRKNNGEKPKYLLRDGLPKIISKKEWNEVQELLKLPNKGRKRHGIKVEKPKEYVMKVKSGIFKDFIVLDAEWSQNEMEAILNKGEKNNDSIII